MTRGMGIDMNNITIRKSIGFNTPNLITREVWRMATLNDNDRKDLWTQFMKDISFSNQAISILKTDLRTAFDSADDQVHSSPSSTDDDIKNSIPTNIKNSLSTDHIDKIVVDLKAKRQEKGL
jgi:hypothetical protein